MREASSIDYMILALARLIRPNEVVFNGVNSILPMVAIEVARKVYQVPFTYINIAGGINPKIDNLPSSTADPLLTSGSKSIFPNEDFYDLCARGGVDLVYLGAAQVDQQGRTNVSVIGSYNHPKVRLPGGGGAAVIMPTAKRVVIWRSEHSVRTFRKNLDFVTASGNVEYVVTPLCVFKKINGFLEVEYIFPNTTFEEIQSNTEFKLNNNSPKKFEVQLHEIKGIDEIDPNGVRFLESRLNR